MEDNIAFSAEQAVIGACIIDKEAAWSAFESPLKPHMFEVKDHGAIYKTIMDMLATGQEIDTLTVANYLKTHGTALEVNQEPVNYLMQICYDAPTAYNIAQYTDIVWNSWRLRQIGRVASKYQSYAIQGQTAKMSVDQAIGAMIEDVYSLTQQGVTPLREVGASAKETWISLYNSRNDPNKRGLQTGFRKMDELLGGIQPGNLVVLAARPSMGKTTLALNIACNVAKQKKPVLFFSLEMSREEIELKVISAMTGLDTQFIRSGLLMDEDWNAGYKATEAMEQLPMRLMIDDTPSLTTAEIRAKARRLRVEKGDIGLVVIDYLGRLGDCALGDEKAMPVLVGRAVNNCKTLAREIGAPVLLLCQLNRNPEHREEKRPMLADLRDSGEIEQAGDTVMFIYRPGRYEKNKQDSTAEVSIAKQRNGKIGSFTLSFNGKYNKFEDMESGIDGFGTYVDKPAL